MMYFKIISYALYILSLNRDISFDFLQEYQVFDSSVGKMGEEGKKKKRKNKIDRWCKRDLDQITILR